MTIQLIVGLGNPGAKYEDTRHNIGAYFVEQLVNGAQQTLRNEKKFFGLLATVSIAGNDCRVLIPTTYMNLSGKAINAVAQFYKIPPESILVIHDELDLEPGRVQLKSSGGHGGHNGLRNTISQLGTQQFHRLRIGIGHPGDRDKVHDYVLSKASKTDKNKLEEACTRAAIHLPSIVQGELQKAMRELHIKETPNGI